jgi:outer membrane protein OmpA-like peptidoglycan-associated protein/ABC-type nitrate/sulfonate/bicarbonate transport system substrate-binding protein
MTTHVKAVLLILILGLAVMVAARLALPLLRDSLQRETSDAVATKGTVRIGMDNWIGYFPLCSPQIQRRMREAGYLLKCQNDDADYEARFRRLASGDLEFAAATVDSYLLGGAPREFPGTIVAVIDESKGGDAVLARKEAVPSLDALKGEARFRVAFTPDSPSEHLLRALGVHFGIALFRQRRGAWRLETSGSSQALKKLLDAEAEVAVLWEPDVSRALAEPGIVKLIGSEDTERLIVDILLVRRRFSQDSTEAVRALLQSYFEALRLYRSQPDLLQADIVEATGLRDAQVDAMLRGVAWAGLTENAFDWFGIASMGPLAEEGLVEAIRGAIGILRESGELDADPLPGGDPYRITNRQFIADLYHSWGDRKGARAAAGRTFAPLPAEGWARLKEVGTLKVEPIGFQRGTAQLADDGRLVLDKAARRLKHYPNFRVLVKGHSGLRGDPQANRRLSQERAQAVLRYLVATYGIDENRIRAFGYGASQPLPREPGESDRAYRYRLPRVELSLAAEDF